VRLVLVPGGLGGSSMLTVHALLALSWPVLRHYIMNYSDLGSAAVPVVQQEMSNSRNCYKCGLESGYLAPAFSRFSC